MWLLRILPLLLLSSVGTGQVQVLVPAKKFEPSAQIVVTVTNKRHEAITYCVDYGQISFKDHGVEAIEHTPTPFYVERKSGRKWQILLANQDVSHPMGAEVLEAGASHDFPFRLNDKGQMRVVLLYWIGKGMDVHCGIPYEGSRKVRSEVFVIE